MYTRIALVVVICDFGGGVVVVVKWWIVIKTLMCEGGVCSCPGVKFLSCKYYSNQTHHCFCPGGFVSVTKLCWSEFNLGGFSTVKSGIEDCKLTDFCSLSLPCEHQCCCSGIICHSYTGNYPISNHIISNLVSLVLARTVVLNCWDCFSGSVQKGFLVIKPWCARYSVKLVLQYK